jgi:hypothetical protein
MCETPDCRGKLIAQGGFKALLSCSLSPDPPTASAAGWALAKLGVSTNPVSYPRRPGSGPESMVKPLLRRAGNGGPTLHTSQFTLHTSHFALDTLQHGTCSLEQSHGQPVASMRAPPNHIPCATPHSPIPPPTPACTPPSPPPAFPHPAPMPRPVPKPQRPFPLPSPPQAGRHGRARVAAVRGLHGTLQPRHRPRPAGGHPEATRLRIACPDKNSIPA